MIKRWLMTSTRYQEGYRVGRRYGFRSEMPYGLSHSEDQEWCRGFTTGQVEYRRQKTLPKTGTKKTTGEIAFILLVPFFITLIAWILS